MNATVEEIMAAAPSVTVAGVTVLHNHAPWRVATNRHPNSDGTSWGWIEGAPGHVCWSNSCTDRILTRAGAEQIIAEHARWLEEQKPVAVKLVEARERFAKAKKEHDAALATYEKAKARVDACAQEMIELTGASA